MIVLTRKQCDSIAAHAKKHAPLEVCGLIGGKAEGGTRTVKKVYFLTNTDASEEHFSMDPIEQFAAIKDMRARGIALLGNFHSHPATPAQPSEEDKRLACDANASYLILSLAGERPSLNSFRIDSNKNVAREELKIVPDASNERRMSHAC